MKSTSRASIFLLFAATGLLSCSSGDPAVIAPPELPPADDNGVTGLPIEAASVNLTLGDSVLLTPSDRVSRSRYVRWHSNASHIATVNLRGWVYGKDSGDAVVTATGLTAAEWRLVRVRPYVAPPIDTTPPPVSDTTITNPPDSGPPIDTTPTTPVPSGPLGLNANLGPRTLFPANNPWNQPVDTARIDPNSDAIIANIGASKRFHPDFGANWNGGPFGIPYVVVSGSQPRVPVSFYYPSESDPGPYPIPPNPPIEGGPNSTGDRHIIIVDRDNWKLWELFDARPNPNGSWSAGSGAVFDLSSNSLRPAGWTSADAAGLPILPGLVRYEEVEAGEIKHALRFTVSRSRKAYIHPARHWASNDNSPLRPPMGMRVRLKADFDISAYPRSAQVILRALKKYGMIVADNGSDWFVSGTADARWNDSEMNTLKQLRGSDFEVILMKDITTP